MWFSHDCAWFAWLFGRFQVQIYIIVLQKKFFLEVITHLLLSEILNYFDIWFWK